VVLRSFGEGVVVEDAVDILLEEVYPKALEEAKLEPGAAGSLEKVEDLDKNPKFTFTVPLAPSVDLGDYRSIRLTYDWQEPGEDKLNDSIEELRQMYAKTETVDRPIEKGDFVMIDLKGVKAKASEEEVALIDRPGLQFLFEMMKSLKNSLPGFLRMKLVGLNVKKRNHLHINTRKTIKTKRYKDRQSISIVTIKMVRGSILLK